MLTFTLIHVYCIQVQEEQKADEAGPIRPREAASPSNIGNGFRRSRRHGIAGPCPSRFHNHIIPHYRETSTGHFYPVDLFKLVAL